MSIMKKLIIALSITAIAFYGCNNTSENTETVTTTETTTETTTTTEGTHAVDVAKTVLKWEGGKKLVASKHNGTIKVSDGNLTLADGNLTAGSFTVDMNTLDNEDLKGTEEIGDLIGHLKSPDFFDVEKFPTATFVVTGAEAVTGNAAATHNITGDLTIKGKTNTVTFPAIVTVNGSDVNAKAKFAIDRSLWDVQYGSESFFKGLGDKVIKNEIDFDLDLTATAK
jgi:polyisoprenoid-binding protein YceI